MKILAIGDTADNNHTLKKFAKKSEIDLIDFPKKGDTRTTNVHSQREYFDSLLISKQIKKIKEIKDIETKKSRLLGKIEVIHSLQQSRPRIVHLFDELAKTTPEGVYLSQFVQSGEALTMNGKSQSNARVSAYMRAIEASKWLTSPQLNIIQTGQGERGPTSVFTLRAVQGKPKQQDAKPLDKKGRG